MLTYGAIQKDGKIILAGQATKPKAPNHSTEFAAIRLTADGTLDPTFGVKGLATFTGQTPAQLTLRPANNEITRGVAIQPNGKIVVTSWLFNNSYLHDGEVFRLNT